jgi:hypothetical protein
MNQDEHYDAVAKELLEGAIHPGTWTRSIAEANGDKERAKAVYIRLRVAQLAEEDRKLKAAEFEEAISKTVSAARTRALNFFALVAFGVCISVVVFAVISLIVGALSE